MTFDRVAFLASHAEAAQTALRTLRHRYGHVPPQEAEVIVALGGDGFMLSTLHQTMDLDVPVYGMNRGTVGFLMNEYGEEDLLERLEASEQAVINPLRMRAERRDGDRVDALAINEVALLRESRQAAKIRISLDGHVRLEELVCDGVMVATPAGSTAYNYSAHGPILPIRARMLALTPVSAFRPRRWRGALLPLEAQVVFDVLNPDKRPISATADHVEVREAVRVSVAAETGIELRLLYDPGHGLEERLIREQFS